ncbi:alpha/beta fold hydrolase [Pendulispora rubella]|uniref:Alpha/beta fold hydrolase n=1 Tax=Pendulispora rubella TaxID=2741070 RepID=A0ABZ2LDK6_9BACT
MTSKDGATSELQVFRAADEHAPVLLVIPAMGTAAGYYDKLGAAFAERGVHAALFELRGNGTSSVRASRGTDFGYGTLIEQDIPPAVERVRALLPRAPLFLLGHSLGGHLAFLSLAREQLGHDVRGVALVASGLPHHMAWPGMASPGIRVLARFMKATSAAVGHYPGKRLGFAGREARTVVSEWAHAVATGEFSFPTTWTGSVPPEQALARVECPVLAVTLARDTFAPSRSTELLLAKVPRCSVSRIRYMPDAALPEAAGNHNRWPRYPDAVATYVSKWALGITRPASVHPPAAGSPS